MAMAARLLITDDETLVVLSGADLHEAEGFDVTLASDGVEAFAAARGLGDALDVLITDLDMPRMAGADLIRALRVNRPSLPVVVVTGSAPPGGAAELQRYCGGHGPLVLVHKPFACWEVTAAVRHAVAGRQRLRAAAPVARVTPSLISGAGAHQVSPTRMA